MKTEIRGMRFYLRLVFVALFSTLLTTAYAQSEFEIDGVVTDETGTHISGAAIKVVSELEGGKLLHATINDAGAFDFIVEPGMYSVEASKNGYHPVIEPKTRIGSGASTIQITLQSL